MDAPITVFAIVTVGLMGGLFFIFSFCVMEALGMQAPASGMATMQEINRTIVNPLFMIVFVGSTVSCGYLLFRSVMDFGEPGSIVRMAGCLAYLIGGAGMTFGYHIPRNNRLDGLRADSEEGIAYWGEYQTVWTRWNHLRALGSALGAGLLAWSLV